MPNLEHYYKKQLEVLKKEPVKVFALIYPYFLVVGLIIGLVYVSNLSQVARSNVPAPLPDSTVQNDLKIVEPRTVPAIDIQTASTPTPELVEKGKNVYTTVCASCHGVEGTGTGPGAVGLNPPARNFTNPEGWKNGPKLSQIYKTLEEGFPGTAMVAYDYLLPEEKIGLAHYIRQTFMNKPPQDTREDLTLLEQTYQLSKGKEISAQIPVETAMELISTDNSSKVQKIISAAGNISRQQNDPGAKIFNKVVRDKARALTTLSNSESWRMSSEQFIYIVTSNLNQNGFNSNVYKLTTEEWSTLQSFVSRYL